MLDTTKEYAFLSYSHNDDIEPILNWFEEKGYNIVYDTELSAGDIWDMKVRRYINSVKCKGVISVLSRSALSSTSVLKETDYINLFNKNSVSILLDNCSLAESFSLIPKDKKEIAQTIIEAFPPEKVFITLNDILSDSCEKLENTLKKWGVFVEERFKGFDSLPVYRYSSDVKGEAERLQTQQKGYYNFDKKILQSAVTQINKDDLVVLDLGCSDGALTVTRFDDDCYKTVIGIDYNENAINFANSANYGDKYHFYNMDLESDSFVSDLTEKLRELGIEKVDLVLIALTLHHLKEPKKLLFRLYDLFSEDGRIVLRGSDDGSKKCYPESELMDEFLTRYNSLIKGVTDRFNGRKLYKQLLDTGYLNISMNYQVTDTCEKSRAEKSYFYNVAFGYREARLREIARINANNKELAKEVEWLLNALSHIKELFGMRDFWCCNISYVAIASVR